MGKKQRKQKVEPPPPKDEEARKTEIDEIKQKLVMSGLAEDLAQMTEIYEIMDTFVTTGQSAAGSIKLEGYQRQLDYVFSSKARIVSWMKMRYTGAAGP